MAMKLQKQAARECGDTNTNRRATVDGEPTAPVAPVAVNFVPVRF